MNRKLGVAATAGVLVVAAVLALSACGGGNGGSGGVASLTDTTGQTTTEGSQGSGAANAEAWERAQLRYARCMRQHGVDFPDPVNGRFEFKQRRGDEQKVERAERACRPILDNATPPPIDEEEVAELREAALEFAKCMRDHGIEMPDPQFSDDEGGFTQTMPPGAEDDPDFEEAQEACQPILEAAGSDGPSGQGDGS